MWPWMVFLIFTAETMCPHSTWYDLVWPSVTLYGLSWLCYGLISYFMVFYGRISSFLVVIDPNSFSLVLEWRFIFLNFFQFWGILCNPSHSKSARWGLKVGCACIFGRGTKAIREKMPLTLTHFALLWTQPFSHYANLAQKRSQMTFNLWKIPSMTMDFWYVIWCIVLFVQNIESSYYPKGLFLLIL